MHSWITLSDSQAPITADEPGARRISGSPSKSEAKKLLQRDDVRDLYVEWARDGRIHSNCCGNRTQIIHHFLKSVMAQRSRGVAESFPRIVVHFHKQSIRPCCNRRLGKG